LKARVVDLSLMRDRYISNRLGKVNLSESVTIFESRSKTFLRIISMDSLRSIMPDHTSKLDQQFRIAVTIVDP